jgi:hypothetical protein
MEKITWQRHKNLFSDTHFIVLNNEYRPNLLKEIQVKRQSSGFVVLTTDGYDLQPLNYHETLDDAKNEAERYYKFLESENLL